MALQKSYPTICAKVQGHYSGKYPYLSNTDQQRLNYLINAISEKNSSYIWALRGGYGSDRLIPSLVKLLNPSIQKRLIGYSDITALHLFLTQSMGLENHTWCGWKRIDRR